MDNWCPECSGGQTRSKHTPEQPATDPRCASCFYNATHPNAPLLTLNDLEALLEEAGEAPSADFLQSLAGRLVDWHGTPVAIHLIQDTVRLELETACHQCGTAGPTVYLGPGLHEGAWPYAYSQDGVYLANLRDQEYVCDSCLPAHQKALARIAASTNL